MRYGIKIEEYKDGSKAFFPARRILGLWIRYSEYDYDSDMSFYVSFDSKDGAIEYLKGECANHVVYRTTLEDVL